MDTYISTIHQIHVYIGAFIDYNGNVKFCTNRLCTRRDMNTLLNLYAHAWKTYSPSKIFLSNDSAKIYIPSKAKVTKVL